MQDFGLKMEDIGSMIQEAAKSLPSLQMLVFLLSGVVGVFTVIFALASYSTEVKRGQSPTAKTLSGLLVGSLLLSLPSVMDVWSYSLFGSSAEPKIVTSAVLSASDPVRRTIHALTLYINFIGWIALARGLWTLKQGPVYQNEGWVSKAIVLMLAGTCAANFALFVDILANTINAQPLGSMYFAF